jgi:hypothetical protein
MRYQLDAAQFDFTRAPIQFIVPFLLHIRIASILKTGD